MKKIKTLLFVFVVGLFLFIGINSNATQPPSSQLTPVFYPIGNSSKTIFDGTETIAHKTSAYSAPFKCSTNFDYVQIYIDEISGSEKVYVVLQELVDGFWLPKQGDPGSEILVQVSLKSNIYLMYCGKDATNYVTPVGADTNKVKSVSTNNTDYAILANHEYRIMVYNCNNFWGKSCKLKATLQVKNV